MAEPAISKDWRGYKVAFPLGGQDGGQEVVLHSARTLLMADVACDLLTLLAAVQAGTPLESLRLRSRRSEQGPLALAGPARAALAAAPFADAVAELQAVIKWRKAPPSSIVFLQGSDATAAGTAHQLLLGAAAGGRALAARLILALTGAVAAAVSDALGSTPLHLAAEGHSPSAASSLELMRLLIRLLRSLRQPPQQPTATAASRFTRRPQRTASTSRWQRSMCLRSSSCWLPPLRVSVGQTTRAAWPCTMLRPPRAGPAAQHPRSCC